MESNLKYITLVWTQCGLGYKEKTKMSDHIIVKTLPKRVATKNKGIYYREIQQTTIDTKGNIKTKVIDKVFIVRYRDLRQERLVTIGKYSEGIREAYCKVKRNEFLTLAKNGELPVQIKSRVKKNIITFDEIAQRHYDEKALHNRDNEKAKRRYELHVKPSIGTMDITTITSEQMQKIQQKKIKTHAPKTVNLIINEASVIFNYAIDKEFIAINPTKKVKRLSIDNQRERFLTSEEITLLLDTVKDNEQLTLFVMLALRTGGRLHAISSIQKKDVDLHHKFLMLKDEKNNSTYKVFIEDPTLIALLAERLKKIQVRDIVLDYKLTGIHYVDKHISNQLQPILNKLFNDGLKENDRKNRVVIHTLRHTFASHLAINSTPIFTIQKLMNHADIAMTMRYAKLAPESGRDAIKELYK